MFVGVLATPAMSSSHCTYLPYRGGTTALLVNPGDVSGMDVDATGCDIGIYYDAAGKFIVEDSTVNGAKRFGIVNNGSTVDILDNEIFDIGDSPFTGNQYGVGIYFDYTNGGSGRINGNSIHDYQKGGIAINGPNSSARVTNNNVDGLDSVPFIAQNGIQFGYGATGTVMSNTVNGNWYGGANWTSTGILLFETDNVTVQGNDVVDNQTGIGIETWSWFVSSASGNKVIHNTITGSAYGAYVAAYNIPGASTGDPVADNNKITNNTIVSSDGDTGVGVFVYNGSTTYTASADNNKLIHNRISGFDTPTYDEGTNTKLRASVIGP